MCEEIWKRCLVTHHAKELTATCISVDNLVVISSCFWPLACILSLVVYFMEGLGKRREQGRQLRCVEGRDT
ncbi:hypothetical protein K431DRAFT_158771 [Polychaeton citri CBS 116435]|uniref:Uncharacterized protein n=1 Tax=Polychaeton citri CBS 116435 TaxID=1314669 RepID=A0A9P4PYN7_9PEZI|nr:hypothetical protein K431DRAFT_158771 [Polychaeton citri CBS 116435]